MEELKYGELEVFVADSDVELGRAAAMQFAEAVKEELHAKSETSVIMALGAAQDSFFGALKDRDDIEWSRITVLHVDTYMGVADARPESGASRLRRHLLDEVKPKKFLPLHGDHVPVEEELARYSGILKELDPQICVVGIGDSGHLAFNDPPADFKTKEFVRVVALSEMTRKQIHHAGTFSTLEEVPRYGLSLTMYALLRPKTVLALVHEAHKARIVEEILEGPVTMMCPASLMQDRANAHLYLNKEVASLLGAR